nr:MAG TPA: hypothetical protein [Caudoviricetes sp.]
MATSRPWWTATPAPSLNSTCRSGPSRSPKPSRTVTRRARGQ